MNIAIILAGGFGLRFDKDIPKQFIKINDKPLLFYTLKVFESCNQIDKILVVVPEQFKIKTLDLIKKYGLKKIMNIIKGGQTRQESSYSALKYLEDKDATIVVIHDAVRPFVSEEIINSSIIVAKEYGAADVIVKITDTIVKARKGFITRIPDRKYLYHGQTPQTFKYSLIWKAHKKAKKDMYINASDDAQLILRLGYKVKTIKGSYQNIKITHKTDLLFGKIFKKMK